MQKKNYSRHLIIKPFLFHKHYCSPYVTMSYFYAFVCQNHYKMFSMQCQNYPIVSCLWLLEIIKNQTQRRCDSDVKISKKLQFFLLSLQACTSSRKISKKKSNYEFKMCFNNHKYLDEGLYYKKLIKCEVVQLTWIPFLCNLAIGVNQ